MADPNWAAVGEMYAFATKLFDLFDLAYSTNVDTPAENLRNDLEGDYVQPAYSGVETTRSLAVAILTLDVFRQMTDPIVAQWTDASAILPKPSIADNWREVYDYMVTNSDSFNRMEWTFGTWAAGGSNVGDMTVARLATDEDNMPMESWWPDTYTLECTEDALTTGREHTATFRLRGTSAGPTSRPIEGAPFEELGIPQHSDLTVEGLSNPSFDLGTFSAATITALTGFTTGSGNFTAFETNTTSTYIFLDTTLSGGTARSLRFIGNDHIYQELQDTGGFSIDDDAPYRFGVWVYRRDTATGNFTIRLTDVSSPTSGGISRVVTLASLNDGAWNFVDLVATPGQNDWPKNFRSEQLALVYQIDTLAVGTAYLDTAVQHRWSRVGANGQAARGRGTNGVYLSLLAGQAQTQKADLFTVTDSIGQTTVNQLRSGLNGAEYGYLPSAAAGETVADK